MYVDYGEIGLSHIGHGKSRLMKWETKSSNQNEEKILLNTTVKRKIYWFGHVIKRKGLLTTALESTFGKSEKEMNQEAEVG